MAFFLSALLQYGIQKIFIFYNRFDDFNHRSSHKTLATRTGGIGIFLTLFIISLFYYFQNIDLFDYSIFIPFGIMFIVGVYDDFYRADFKLKFLLQIIVSKILIDQGYVISNYQGLFGIYEVPWLIAQLTTGLIFLTIINAFNFVDGIDGLAITVIVLRILFIEFFSASNTILFPISIILIAAILPLYYFNFKKFNKIFLGDGGSMFLGTVLSVYLFFLLKNDYVFKNDFQINKIIFISIIFFYPILDLIRVFLKRLYNGNSPFLADQNHLHHLLLKILKKQYLVTLIINVIDVIFILITLSTFYFFKS